MGSSHTATAVQKHVTRRVDH